jgi:acyl-CoA synthetase (AMP-forming)/AMP-acid ligase II
MTATEHATIAENLVESFRAVPEQTALVLLHSNQAEQIIRYHDLEAGSSAYAQILAQAGISPGEVVILILPHGQELVFSFFGVILHGAIPSIMPFLTEKLSPEQYRSSLAALFEITAPAAVITYPEFATEVYQAAAGTPCIHAVLVSSHRCHGELPWSESSGDRYSPASTFVGNYRSAKRCGAFSSSGIQPIRTLRVRYPPQSAGYHCELVAPIS